MAGDPFGLLLRQRIVFFGGEVRRGVAGRQRRWQAVPLGRGDVCSLAQLIS